MSGCFCSQMNLSTSLPRYLNLKDLIANTATLQSTANLHSSPYKYCHPPTNIRHQSWLALNRAKWCPLLLIHPIKQYHIRNLACRIPHSLRSERCLQKLQLRHLGKSKRGSSLTVEPIPTVEKTSNSQIKLNPPHS